MNEGLFNKANAEEIVVNYLYCCDKKLTMQTAVLSDVAPYSLLLKRQSDMQINGCLIWFKERMMEW